MFLAAALAEHPTETRADLQRYFNLNLDRLGQDFGVFHAAECLACLPLGSSLMRVIHPLAGWTNAEILLHGIWQSICGKEIPFPWDKSGEVIETEGLPLDEFKDWYENTQWKEVESWRQEVL